MPHSIFAVSRPATVPRRVPHEERLMSMSHHACRPKCRWAKDAAEPDLRLASEASNGFLGRSMEARSLHGRRSARVRNAAVVGHAPYLAREADVEPR
jgi:hypothetical protein